MYYEYDVIGICSANRPAVKTLPLKMAQSFSSG